LLNLATGGGIIRAISSAEILSIFGPSAFTSRPVDAQPDSISKPAKINIKKLLFTIAP
jgi:hypothetical protein